MNTTQENQKMNSIDFEASLDYTIQCVKWCVENDDLIALREHINLHGARLIANERFLKELEELLKYSCVKRRTDIAIELLDCLESDVEYQLKDRKSWCSKLFYNVVAAGSTMIVKDFINKGADVNGMFYGKPIVHIAACSGYLDVVRRLVHAGSNVHSVDQRGNGIIHNLLTSALSKKDVMVHEIIKLGADPLVKSTSGKLPIHLAAMHAPEVLDVFLDIGQNVNIVEEINNETPLHVACGIACKESIIKLIHFGCKFNMENNNGETPLAKLLRFTNDVNDFHSKTRVQMARRLIDIGFRMSQQKSKQEKGKLHGRDKAYDRYILIKLSVKTPPTLQETARQRVRECLNASSDIHKHVKALDIPLDIGPFILHHDFKL